MPLIGVLNSMVDGTFVTAGPHNANYDAIKTAFNSSAVLTDVVKTITVSHNWNAVQNFVGGLTANVTGNLTGTVLTAAQANITSLGTLTQLIVASGGKLYVDGGGDTYFLESPANTISVVAGGAAVGAFGAAGWVGNVTGNLTGTVQTAAQANITSLGTLTAISVSGDAAFGTGHIRPGVSTSVTGATTIYSPSGPFGLVYVYGDDGAGKRFFDVVLHTGFTAPQVLHTNTLAGAPAARTYTAPGSVLILAMAAGTYTVKCMPFEVN